MDHSLRGDMTQHAHGNEPHRSPHPRRITVSRLIDAPVERVFALLADPDQHPKIDGSGQLRRSRTHMAITDVGEVFTTDMRDEEAGDYQVDNLVTTYVRDQAIGWAPSPKGHEPTGHTYTFQLTPQGPDRTLVTQTYDWSAVTEELLPEFPTVSRDQLTASLDRMAAALHGPGANRPATTKP
jgi:uncharacterized protein YndB with AHSA1/START domain